MNHQETLETPVDIKQSRNELLAENGEYVVYRLQVNEIRIQSFVMPLTNLTSPCTEQSTDTKITKPTPCPTHTAIYLPPPYETSLFISISPQAQFARNITKRHHSTSFSP